MEIKKTHFILIVVLTTFLAATIIGAAAYFLYSNSNEHSAELIKSTKQPESEISVEKSESTTDEETTRVITHEEILYYGSGSQGNYSLIDINSGEVVDNFIPEGYQLVGQHEYEMFPRFLILQKEDQLFSYDVENKLMNAIFSDSLRLNENERVILYPSITEQDEFLIVVNEYDPNEQSEIGLPTPIDTRTYFFDADIHGFSKTVNFDLGYCSEYDSKHARIFKWECGEGIGSSLPLSTVSADKEKQEHVILSPTSFSLKENQLGPIAVTYNAGLFIISSKNTFDKVIVIDPSDEDINISEYTVSDTVINQLDGRIYPYSAVLVEANNTLVIGGSTSITLLRVDGEQIIDSKAFPEKGVYANFIFPYNGKLYYHAKQSDAIRIIDLDTWMVTKTIPADIDEEITLFK